MGAVAIPAFAVPQATGNARQEQSSERSRPAPAKRAPARQAPAKQAPARRSDGQGAVPRQGSDGGGQSGPGATSGNPHVPNKRAYVDRLRLEVSVHRTRMARLNQLETIYTNQANRAKLSEVHLLRNREVNRFQLLLKRFRDALGAADFEKAAQSLRLRGREAAAGGNSQQSAQQRSRGTAPVRQN